MTFFPTLPSVNENSELESYSVSPLQYLYLSVCVVFIYIYLSAFLVSSTDANKQLFNAKYLFKSLIHGFSM